MDSIDFDPVGVPHPGEVIAEYLEHRAWSQSDLARRTGLSAKTISEICNRKAPVSPPTSLALEKVLGRPAHFWINLQARFDEAQARLQERKRSTEWVTWVSRFPLREMKRRGWLPKETGESDAALLLRFLGVSSPESWSAVWSTSHVAFRQTRTFSATTEAVSAWIRATELEADSLSPLSEFSEDRLRESLADLRRLTRIRIDQALERAQSLCAAFGVAFVVVPELPRTGISGCARWLNDGRAVLAVTLRYKWDDQIWFTFFHELGHILLHRKKHMFILDNADENLLDRIVDPEMQGIEEEANRFSADTLIPPKDLREFIDRKVFTNESIHDFSESVGIGPGVVVGRLQREGLLQPHQGNALKQRVDWSTQKVD